MYDSANIDRTPKGIANCIIYGDLFKTDAAVRAHLRAAGYNDEAISNIKLIDKTKLTFEGLVKAISDATGVVDRANIGIRAARQDNLIKEGEDPGRVRFLEVQSIKVDGIDIVAAMNSYQVLLKILTQTTSESIAIDAATIPGLAMDGVRKILIYLPPTIPINYGEEIRAYQDALKLLSMAA